MASIKNQTNPNTEIYLEAMARDYTFQRDARFAYARQAQAAAKASGFGDSENQPSFEQVLKAVNLTKKEKIS
jgi:hypothetical protein